MGSIWLVSAKPNWGIDDFYFACFFQLNTSLFSQLAIYRFCRQKYQPCVVMTMQLIVTMWEVTRCARGLATSNAGQWVVTEARYGPCLSCLRVSELNISVLCHITQPRFEWHSCVCNLFYGLVSGLGESKQSKARCFVSWGLTKLRLFLLYLVQIHLTNSCFWVSHICVVHRQRISLQGCNMHIVSSLHLVTRKPQECSSELDKKQWSNKALAYPELLGGGLD